MPTMTRKHGFGLSPFACSSAAGVARPSQPLVYAASLAARSNTSRISLGSVQMLWAFLRRCARYALAPLLNDYEEMDHV